MVAGTGGNSTHEAIELTVSAAEAGADYSLSVTPYYNKPTQQGLFEHFQAVARSVNLPIILYNVPGRTGCDLLNDTVVKLSQIDNIVAIKDATGDVARVAALIEAVPDGFAVFSGDDATALELMRRGGQGNVSVTANIAARDMADVCNLALTGHWEAAAEIDARLSELNDLLFIEANPIPVKWAMAQRGMIDDGFRLPLTPLSALFRGDLMRALVTYFELFVRLLVSYCWAAFQDVAGSLAMMGSSLITPAVIRRRPSSPRSTYRPTSPLRRYSQTIRCRQ